jgi:hypothetical protein
MHPHTFLYRSLLGSFLLAAGCAAQEEAFLEDETRLHCDIRVACGESLNCTDLPLADDNLGRCTRFRPSKADECLYLLEAHLTMVEEDASTCDDSHFDYAECHEALTPRGGLACTSVDEGRPLRHDGHAVLAAVVQGHAWSEQSMGLEPSSSRAEAAAAAHWLAIARSEHASVAAFSRVCLELMEVGAPPHLLEGCHRAALDEVRHARLALDVARSLGDPAWDLGPLSPVPFRVPTLREIAVDALLEGCLGEGAAAARASIAADRSHGPVAQVLSTIAADETRHASLAWATVRWALQRDRSLADSLREALELARAAHAVPPSADTDPALARLGVMTIAEAARIERDVLELVVCPVLEELLGATGATTRSYAALT